MNYAKPPLTLAQQVALLQSRGMTGEPVLMEQRLASVSYYRLSGYWFPFRNPDDTFQPGTSFEEVWHRYTFDRSLRLLILDAIERIEVAIRALLAYHHSMAHGPFAYADNRASLPGLSPKDFSDFVGRIADEAYRSRREPFVEHFRRKFSNPHLPVWMATEIMAFGTMLTFYRGASLAVRKQVAKPFDVAEPVFATWLLTHNTVRNICAHHGRLWNRELGTKPLIPTHRLNHDWHEPFSIPNDRSFGILSICRHSLRRLSPQSHWPARFQDLLNEYPDIPLGQMGMPPNWKDHAVWRDLP